MKKIVSLLLMLILVFGTLGTAHAAGVKVIVDGQTLNAQCVIVNGRTLAPVRAISEAMRATVLWDEAAQEITITKLYYDNIGGVTKSEVRNARMWIGKNVGNVNGDIQIDMDVPAQIINGNTMIPVAALGQMLSAEVKWDQATQTVTITSTLQSTKGGADAWQGAVRDNEAQYLKRINDEMNKVRTDDPLYPYGYNTNYISTEHNDRYKAESTYHHNVVVIKITNVTTQKLPARELYFRVTDERTNEVLDMVPFEIGELNPGEQVTIDSVLTPNSYQGMYSMPGVYPDK